MAGMIVARWWQPAERIGSWAAILVLYLTWGAMLGLLEELLNGGPMWIFAALGSLLILPVLMEARPLIAGAGLGWSSLLAGVLTVRQCFASDADIVRRAMAKNPDERFQSADAFLQAVKSATTKAPSVNAEGLLTRGGLTRRSLIAASALIALLPGAWFLGARTARLAAAPSVAAKPAEAPPIPAVEAIRPPAAPPRTGCWSRPRVGPARRRGSRAPPRAGA